MIRLLLADDHGIVREGLRQLFATTSDIKVIGEASNGSQVLAAVMRGGLDLLLLDMNMPGVSGISLIEQIHGQNPRLPILVLSMLNEPQIAKRALKAGASGYLTKDSDPDQLFTSIRKVALGGRCVDPSIAEQMALTMSNGDGPLHDRLSLREFEIFQLLAKGLGVNEIAAQLAISNKTVSTHKARLMEKLELKTNTELVRYALDNKLLE